MSRLNYRKVQEFKDYSTAYHGAVSAVKVALELLSQDTNEFDGEGDDWWRPVVYNYRGISISMTIRDECGKLSINRLEDKRLFEALKRLFDELEIELSVADSIKDWVDSDSISETEGAEGDYYQALGYRIANSPVKSLGELYLVKGITDSLYRKLSNYLTVYGEGKVNVNSAPPELLMALSDALTRDVADSIIEARPIKSLEELRELPGMSKELYFEIRPLITNKCDYFKVEVTASYGDATARIVAYTTRKKVLEWKVVQ
jgi:general secretion pathway protein K